jgi:hypothetical protein
LERLTGRIAWVRIPQSTISDNNLRKVTARHVAQIAVHGDRLPSCGSWERLQPVSAKEVVMARKAKLNKAMKMIVVATGIVLGGTSLSTAALARGGGGGGHFGGGSHFGGGHMFGGFHGGHFHGGHEHGELRHGFNAYGSSPYFCGYPYRSSYMGCF